MIPKTCKTCKHWKMDKLQTEPVNKTKIGVCRFLKKNMPFMENLMTEYQDDCRLWEGI
jgi:hypothetical protein